MLPIKLICLPYAGGSVSMYRDWPGKTGQPIEVELIELAGRGSRYKEPVYKTFDEMIEDIFNKSKLAVGDSDFSFFGYSMGSILAFELSRQFKIRLCKEPKQLFVAASNAPHISYEISQKQFGNLSDAELDERIIKMGGIPDEIKSNQVYFELCMSLIRHDLNIACNYHYRNNPYQLNCEITVLCGKNDPQIDIKRITEWDNTTSEKCSYYFFEGDHFFIREFDDEIIKVVNHRLKANTD
ncbi:MAG: thioesterase domain-containing protein [Anaerocolumna sp.]